MIPTSMISRRIISASLSFTLLAASIGGGGVSAFRPSQYGNGNGVNFSNANLNPPPGGNNPNSNNPDPSILNEYDPNAGSTASATPYGHGDINGHGHGNANIDNFDYNEPPGGTQQSVEERLSAWRQQQQFKYEHQSPIDAANPRDEDGKMKLLASVSRGSIAMFFFILMWRSVHHYELADGSFQNSAMIGRLIMVFPPVILFIANMAGCVGSIMSSGHLGKKRMKAILNLNKLMEITLMAYNVLCLLIRTPTKLIPREIYVGRILSNFLFLVQCQLFTKVSWNSGSVNKENTADAVYGNMGAAGAGAGTGVQSGNYGYYDDDDEDDDEVDYQGGGDQNANQYYQNVYNQEMQDRQNKGM